MGLHIELFWGESHVTSFRVLQDCALELATSVNYLLLKWQRQFSAPRTL